MYTCTIYIYVYNIIYNIWTYVYCVFIFGIYVLIYCRRAIHCVQCVRPLYNLYDVYSGAHKAKRMKPKCDPYLYQEVPNRIKRERKREKEIPLWFLMWGQHDTVVLGAGWGWFRNQSFESGLVAAILTAPVVESLVNMMLRLHDFGCVVSTYCRSRTS